MTDGMPENVLSFARLLRQSGMHTSPNQAAIVLQAFDHINIANRHDFYFALRSLLLGRKEDYPVFDRIFREFWEDAPRLKQQNEQIERRQNPSKQDSKTLSLVSAYHMDELNSDQSAAIYSAREILGLKDFSELTQQEEREIMNLIEEFQWTAGFKRTRRWRSGYGPRYDLRSTLRLNLRFGSEVLSWKRKQREERSRPVVILMDISRSMKDYSRILLHFFYILSVRPSPVEVFVFGTRLTRITDQLNHKQPRQALSKASQHMDDWGGGTRIGESIKRFNYDWARRVLRSSAVVLLASDGWDRGDPKLLKTEIARLRRSCHRLIWLNPLLGSADYQPLTRGMQAALPYVDDFLPVHNLASIEQLAERLTSLEGPVNRRPAKLRAAHARYSA
jgi:hypothetical protein